MKNNGDLWNLIKLLRRKHNMATLKATVEKLIIEEHPNADALEIAVIGGYRAIVGKGQFNTGDLAVYIPEQSILPQWLVSEMGLEGRLAGRESNRVKAVKLRKVLSQGLVYGLETIGTVHNLLHVDEDGQFRSTRVKEGDDVTDILGIVKYEPAIPTHMNGEVWNAYGLTLKYDIENWQNYPEILESGESVVFTEKIHGTFCCYGYCDGQYIVTSKGMSGKGLAFKLNENNASNLYVRQFVEHGGQEILDSLIEVSGSENVFILGEIFGKGVQDLSYGMQAPTFRIFDIFLGGPSTGAYAGYFDMIKLLKDTNAYMRDHDIEVVAETVPVLFQGRYSPNAMENYTTGTESVSGKSMNIREGIVMRPAFERYDNELGRVILKSVSEQYLLRKGDTTEFN